MRALRRLAMKKPAVSSSSSTHKPPSPVLAPGYEENPQNYRPGGYHPVVLGTVFRDGRYHVTRKLGFGVYSTVWLCRDKQENRFVALKILRADSTKTHNQPNEADILRSIAEGNPHHLGREHIVKILDSFVHDGPNGAHSCIVFEALGQSVLEFQRNCKNGRLPLEMVRPIARQLLLALDYIHSECRLIHTDVQSGNILFDIGDIANKSLVESTELPTGDRARIPSQPLRWTASRCVKIKLTDFGVANWIDRRWLKIVQPDGYRAPEVTLESGWSTPVDIWSFGCIVFEMYIGKYLFNPRAQEGWSKDDDLLAQMMELTETKRFPIELLERSEAANKFFDYDGTLIRIKELQETTPEDVIRYMNPELGERERKQFASFLMAVMQLDPSVRPTAAELLEHPWINE